MNIVRTIVVSALIASTVGATRMAPANATGGGTFSVSKIPGEQLAAIFSACQQFETMVHVRCSDKQMSRYAVYSSDSSNAFVVSFFHNAQASGTAVVIRSPIATFEVDKQTLRARRITTL